MEINVPLLLQIREKILESPEMYDQDSTCGTAFCVGGWANLLSGHMPGGKEWAENSGLALGIEPYSAKFWDLCFPVCSLWPPIEASKYYCSNPEHRAQMGAEHIDRFIAKYAPDWKPAEQKVEACSTR